MPVRIRPAVDADRSAIYTVHMRAIRETCSRSYSDQQIASWATLFSPDSYATVIKERVFIVADEEHAVVGFGQLNPEIGEVDAVYVLPERQGEGIGRLLLSNLEDAARERGLGTLTLSANRPSLSLAAICRVMSPSQ